MAQNNDSMVMQLVGDSRLMAEALKKRLDVVKRVGITEEAADALEGKANALHSLNVEQEELKAKLKAKTAEIDAAKKELTALLAENRKLVKIAVDKTDWLTFGISDKK